MNLIRIIAVALLIWLVLTMIKQFRNKQIKSDQLKDQSKNHNDGGAILQCSHCGVHIPEHEALAKADGKVYCSPECAKH